jgi:hypothetical protein
MLFNCTVRFWIFARGSPSGNRDRERAVLSVGEALWGRPPRGVAVREWRRQLANGGEPAAEGVCGVFCVDRRFQQAENNATPPRTAA